jgi:hypothetical protein
LGPVGGRFVVPTALNGSCHIRSLLILQAGSAATSRNRLRCFQSGRMHGDDALCSTAALICEQILRQISADNFAMKRRNRGRVQIHSAPHLSRQGFRHGGESREKRACARDLRTRGTRRVSLSPRIGRIWRNLSRRVLPRSADHRHRCAFSFSALLQG